MTCYICDVCRDKLPTKQWKNKDFQRVSSLESSFTCSECWKLFSMAFEVTNRDEKECYTFSERNYLLRSHSRESAIDCPQDYYLTGNCDETEPKFTNISEINSSAFGSQTLLSDECVDYLATYNIQKKKADEKASSHVCKLSSSIKSSYTFKESDEKNPIENQHVNNIPLIMDEASQISTSSPTNKNSILINNNLQGNLSPSRYEISNDNIGYNSCLEQPVFKDKDRDKRPYKCNICSSTFKRNSSLSYHMVTHSEKRPYKCNICPSNFKVKHALTLHLAIHSEKRPYKCNICPLAFKLKSYFTRHLLATHSEKRPFKCNVCSSTFKLKHHLTRHSAKH